MRVFVAEKPSVARTIVEALPPAVRSKHAGFTRVGPDTIVTWCIGHLLELAPPSAYDAKWEKWDLATLPITVDPDRWQLVPRDGVKDQVKILRGLLQQATVVVNAGDPGREGQLLVDEVLHYCGYKGRVDRIVIRDPTAAGVRKSLQSLRPNAEFQNLYHAALCRSRADWLFGLNLTRALSKRIGLTASLGRVQTPTLALIVRRDLEIEGHASSKFYTLHAHVSTQADALVLSHEPKSDRITDAKEAKRIAAALSGQIVELRSTETPVTEGAPLPHILATFHEAGEAMYGWTAKKALEVLQELYEKKLVTYPRTECPYLPEDQMGAALPLATAIMGAGHFPAAKPCLPKMLPSKKVYNNAKLDEHHGVIPTSLLPGKDLDRTLLQGWQIIAERFLKSLMPDYVYAKKEVAFDFDGRTFKVLGETPINEAMSWRALEPRRGRDGNPIEPLKCSIPDGQTAKGRAGEVAVKEGKTTPPKPYTEATLIKDMRSIHLHVSDPRLAAMLKETTGIGTAATQEGIIETLKLRKYAKLEKSGKRAFLRSTTFGRYIIANIPAALSDPGVTGAWEEQLNQIAKGTADAGQFMTRIDAFINKNLTRIVETDFPAPPAVEVAAPKAKPRARKRA